MGKGAALRIALPFPRIGNLWAGQTEMRGEGLTTKTHPDLLQILVDMQGHVVVG